jgi:DNA helicase HerA-like ATPase
VSTLDAKGSPTVTERAWIAPPASRIGPITDAECAAVREQTRSLYGHYEQAIDRESAFEKLGAGGAGKAGGAGTPGGAGQAGTIGTAGPSAGSSITDTLSAMLLGTTGPRGGHHDGLVQSAAKSAARSVGSGLGRAILRGALGSILGGSTRRTR